MLMVIYKTRNIGKGNGKLGKREKRGMLYFKEFCATFRGMSPNIPGNVAKHSGECTRAFRGISRNIPANVTNITWVNVAKHSRKYR